MKAKNIKCKKCGGFPEIHGEESPFFIACKQCGEESIAWAYPREAWAQWKHDNQKAEMD